MKTYIGLLRGINVSGQKSVKMAVLKNRLMKLGFSGVVTYIQSGNVVFRYKNTDSQVLEKMIHETMMKEFGYDVVVLVLSLDQLKKIIAENSFANDSLKESRFLHVTLLAQQPAQYDRGAIVARKAEAEEIIFGDKAVYLFCPKGYGKTKLNNNFLENQLKVQATTRNWKTTLKLLDIAEGMEK